MRRIGTLDSDEHARRFEDYLLTIGIKGVAEQSDDGWSLWVYDEDQVDRAKDEFERFVQEPDAEVFRKTTASAQSLRREAEKQNAAYQKRMIDVRRRWERPVASQCPITIGLIGISLLVAFASRMGEQHEPVLNALVINSYDIEGNSILYHTGLYDVSHFEVWRLVTPIFIHFGLWHLLFNVLMTYSLGIPVERRRGWLRMLLIVLAIAIPSNLGQYWVSGPSFGGMSGVVYGLFGYIWMKSRFDPAAGLYMPPNTVFWLLAWFLICFTGAVGNVANTVHAIGLGAGLLIGYLPTRMPRKR